MALFLGSARDVPDKYERAHQGALEMSFYFREVIAERRRRPGADRLSAAAMLFLFTGHETSPTSSIRCGCMPMPGRGWWPILRPTCWRWQWRNVCARMAPRVVSPGWSLRVALEIEGRKLKEGDRVFAMLNAANRGPRFCEAPDDFIIDRSPNRYLTFGQGHPFLLGAPLVRLEAEIAQRILDLTLATTTADWHDSPIMRGITSLPVHFQPIKSALA